MSGLPPTRLIAEAFGKVATNDELTPIDTDMTHEDLGEVAAYMMQTEDGPWAIQPQLNWNSYRKRDSDLRRLWQAAYMPVAARAAGVITPEPLTSRQGHPIAIVGNNGLVPWADRHDPAHDYAVVLTGQRYVEPSPWRFGDPDVARSAGTSLGKSVALVPWEVGPAIIELPATDDVARLGFERPNVDTRLHGVVWRDVAVRNVILRDGIEPNLIDPTNSNPDDVRNWRSSLEVSVISTWNAFATNALGGGEIWFEPGCEGPFFSGFVDGYISVVPEQFRPRFVDLFGRQAAHRLAAAQWPRGFRAADEVVEILNEEQPYGVVPNMPSDWRGPSL